VDIEGGRALAHARIKEGLAAAVDVPPPVHVAVHAENIPLDVLHEDPDVVVINKPAGLVVHPAAGHASGTLVNALLHRCPDLEGIGGEKRPGIVHRLDKDTSGVMVVAKTDQAMESLTRQFRRGEVQKEYVALVHGLPDPKVGRIETLIGRSHHDRKKMSARPRSGRTAITRYRVKEVFKVAALVQVDIETGRTHQIRVHMAHIGHPVVGDRQYGRPPGRRALDVDGAQDPGTASRARSVDRQMLHSARLAFAHPHTGEKAEYRAPVPQDMARLLTRLRRQAGRT